jgi:hypothetical protein
MRHLLPPVDYLSCFHDRVQCHRLPAGDLIKRLVHSAYPFHHAAKDSWTTYIVWRVQTGPLRHRRQSSCTRVLVIRCYLDAVPHNTASHREQHELCRSSFGRRHFRSTTGLDNQWPQEVQDTCAAEIVMALGGSWRRNLLMMAGRNRQIYPRLIYRGADEFCTPEQFE